MNNYNKSDLAKMKKDELIELIMNEIEVEEAGEIPEKEKENNVYNKEFMSYKIGYTRGGIAYTVYDLYMALEALKKVLEADLDTKVDYLSKAMKVETVARISTSQIDAIKKMGEQYIDKRLNQIFVKAYLEKLVKLK